MFEVVRVIFLIDVVVIKTTWLKWILLSQFVFLNSLSLVGSGFCCVLLM